MELDWDKEKNSGMGHRIGCYSNQFGKDWYENRTEWKWI